MMKYISPVHGSHWSIRPIGVSLKTQKIASCFIILINGWEISVYQLIREKVIHMHKSVLIMKCSKAVE